jgi:hypothetical protein
MLTHTRNLAAEMKDIELYIVDLGIEIGKIQSRFFLYAFTIPPKSLSKIC